MSVAGEGLWERFRAKAEALGSTVQCAPDWSAAGELIARGTSSPTFTRALAEAFPTVAAGDGTAAAADAVARGLFAVAETGSVLVSEDSRDRGACFLAERLWLVVAADQIVPTLDGAFERLGERIRAGERYLVFMSGPSRSADIERTLTIGVHGPRALTIVIVGEEAG